MMLLSRFWYLLMGIAVAVALSVAYLAVGQFNRRAEVSMHEALAADSQAVEWALKIDGRRRLDALLPATVEPGVQKGVIESSAAADKGDKVPQGARDGATKALGAYLESLAKAEEKSSISYKPDIILAVDREGRVVAQVGGERELPLTEENELGGFPAVKDALHGYVRDDAWLLGPKLYLVFCRPVEVAAGELPAGAIVGLREVSQKFAEDIAKQTRSNLIFLVHPKGEPAARKLASSAGTEGFVTSQLDEALEPSSALGEKYETRGRSDIVPMRDDLATIYVRLAGEAFDQKAAFAVMRQNKALITSPYSFVTSADDKDKARVPWLLLGGVALGLSLLGIFLTFAEHSLPLRGFQKHVALLKSGPDDSIDATQTRGAFRRAAQDINAGIERILEKGGSRKKADLESILGPMPAQPVMSAFALPGASVPAPSSGMLPPMTGSNPQVMSPFTAPPLQRPAPQPTPPPPPVRPAPPPLPTRKNELSAAVPAISLGGLEDEDATTVAPIPAEILANATGEQRSMEGAEWLSVFEEFVRIKKQCGEPVEGLTFEKFQYTLRKNRDTLVAKHGCKRVKFSVYVKDGRASLKATPVRG